MFDLKSDPLEVSDLWDAPQHQAKREELKRELYAICNPKEVSEQAFREQRIVINANGGMEGIMKTTNIPFTPAPE